MMMISHTLGFEAPMFRSVDRHLLPARSVPQTYVARPTILLRDACTIFPSFPVPHTRTFHCHIFFSSPSRPAISTIVLVVNHPLRRIASLFFFNKAAPTEFPPLPLRAPLPI